MLTAFQPPRRTTDFSDPEGLRAALPQLADRKQRHSACPLHPTERNAALTEGAMLCPIHGRHRRVYRPVCEKLVFFPVSGKYRRIEREERIQS